MSTPQDNLQVKITLVGDSKCGKSSIVSQYVDSQFSEKTRSTIGSDIKTKNLTHSSSQKLIFNIWDTAGEERFKPLNRVNVLGTKILLVVFDVTNAQSYQSVTPLLKEYDPKRQMTRVLVGNKMDLEETRTVTRQDAELYSKKHFDCYIETSAKDSQSIIQLFNIVADLSVPKAIQLREDNVVSTSKELMKVVLVGDTKVGKTAIAHQFVKQEFLASHQATIGVYFRAKKIQLDDNEIDIKIWDTAGYNAQVLPSFKKNADAILYVYDVNDPQSLDRLRPFFNEYKDVPNAVHILVGNKIDIENDNPVSLDEIFRFGKHLQHGFIVSAKTGANIDNLFQMTAKLVLLRAPSEETVYVPEIIMKRPIKKEKGGFFACRSNRNKHPTHVRLVEADKSELDVLIDKLKAKRDQLTNQIDSRARFPNKERKISKRNGLSVLIDALVAAEKSPSEALDEVKPFHPALFNKVGIRQETQNLIKELEVLATRERANSFN